MQPIRLELIGTLRGFEQGFAQLLTALDAEGAILSRPARYNVELVFEEIIGNIVRYAAPQGGELHIAVSIDINADGIVIIIEDDGIAFDPCLGGDAVVSKDLAATRDGGFGLKIVRHAALAMHYERLPNQGNRLIVTLSA